MTARKKDEMTIADMQTMVATAGNNPQVNPQTLFDVVKHEVKEEIIRRAQTNPLNLDILLQEVYATFATECKKIPIARHNHNPLMPDCIYTIMQGGTEKSCKKITLFLSYFYRDCFEEVVKENPTLFS